MRAVGLPLTVVCAAVCLGAEQETANNSPVWTFTGHTKEVHDLAFSPDGRLLASASWDETVKIWSVADGRELRTLKGHKG